MGLVVRRFERALVVIEPPGEARVPRVPEVDYRILLAGERVLAEELPGTVGEAAERDLVHR